MLNTLRPIILKDNETWAFNKAERNGLLTFERKILRSSSEAKKEHNDGEVYYNY